MTSARDAALDAMLDRQAISDCLLRYARGVDRLDPNLVRSAFWPDAHDAHGAINGSIEDFLAAWLPTQGKREACQHVIANHTVSFDGPDAANTETYLVVAMKDHDSPTLELIGGRYIDRFEKRDGEWRIKTRLCLIDWQCTTDASGMVERMLGAYRGSRDGSDPSYERPVRIRLSP